MKLTHRFINMICAMITIFTIFICSLMIHEAREKQDFYFYYAMKFQCQAQHAIDLAKKYQQECDILIPVEIEVLAEPFEVK